MRFSIHEDVKVHAPDPGVGRLVADVLGPELAVDPDDDTGTQVAKLQHDDGTAEKEVWD